MEQPHNRRFDHTERAPQQETPKERGERHKKTFFGALIAFVMANMVISVGALFLFFIAPCLGAMMMTLFAAPSADFERIDAVAAPGVDIERVEVHLASSPLGISPEVELDARVLEDMPFVAPSYKLMMRCEREGRSYSGDAVAFHMVLGDAKQGASVHDSVRPFHARSMPAEPEQCDITLQRQHGGGVGDAMHFCYRAGDKLATSGRCASAP